MDKDEAKQLIRDFQGVADMPEGKRMLENLSEECFENKNTFVPSSQFSTAFNEGKRYVILYIRGVLTKDPNVERQTETIKEKENE